MRRRGGAGGYALPLALGVIAVMSVIVLTGAERVSRTQTVAFELRQEALVDRALHDAEAIATGLIATRAHALDGLVLNQVASDQVSLTLPVVDEAVGENLLRFDGAPRRIRLGDVDVTLRLYNADGLVSLIRAEDAVLQGLLMGFGVSRAQSADLVAALQDYQDADDRPRRGGAEITQYARAGLPSPKNEPLGSPREVFMVYGWGDLERLVESGFLDTVSVSTTRLRPSSRYMPQTLRDALDAGLTSADARLGLLSDLARSSGIPTSAYRLELYAVSTQTGTGLKRVFEIRADPARRELMFARSFIYETPISTEQARELLTNETARLIDLRDVFDRWPGPDRADP